MEVTPTTTIAMATHTTTCGGSTGHGLQMKTAKERMVEESQLNNEVPEEQNGENFLHRGIHNNEEACEDHRDLIFFPRSFWLGQFQLVKVT